MNLKEFQERFGIKRINFEDVEESKYDKEYASDNMICPYCKESVELPTEDYNDALHGTPIECPCCGKWFFVEAEISIETTTMPMETAVLEHKDSIERIYKHIDECEKAGIEFPQKRWDSIEWEAYWNFARPLFENEKHRYNVKFDYYTYGVGFETSEIKESFLSEKKMTAEDYYKENRFNIPYDGIQITLTDVNTEEESTFFVDLRL